MIVLIKCDDSVGLVSAIAGVAAQNKLNIISMREHVDEAENLFFARLQLQSEGDAAQLRASLQAVLPPNAEISINPQMEKKIVLLVTKEYHCLSDILIRNHFKTLGAKVQCVIGNHENLKDITCRMGLPYYFVSSDDKTKEAFETELKNIIGQYTPDYIVLAKFMRILSPEFIEQYPLKIVNIHHSFLPAFIGARPYQQAHKRGVKIIGATAHYVTNHLDEGPIIAQQVISVDHTYTEASMKIAGKEIEKSVLATALQNVLQDRVLVYNNKTVVFD